MTVTEFKRPEYFEKIAENVSHLKVFIEFQFSDLFNLRQIDILYFLNIPNQGLISIKLYQLKLLLSVHQCMTFT